MTDLEVILNRIRKLQAERELMNIGEHGSLKERWRERGFDSGLNWVENEILDLLENNAMKD